MKNNIANFFGAQTKHGTFFMLLDGAERRGRVVDRAPTVFSERWGEPSPPAPTCVFPAAASRRVASQTRMCRCTADRWKSAQRAAAGRDDVSATASPTEATRIMLRQEANVPAHRGQSLRIFPANPQLTEAPTPPSSPPSPWLSVPLGSWLRARWTAPKA